MPSQPGSLAPCLCVVAVLHACGTRYLPPPAMPEHVVSTLAADDNPAPGAGEGTVILDTVGGPARAEEVTERSTVTSGYGSSVAWRSRGSYATGSQITTHPLCITPCAINLSLGQHEVQFSAIAPGDGRASTTFVRVGPHPVVVRHAMGFQETHVGTLIASLLVTALGGATMLSGAALAIIGQPHPPDTDLRPAGFITLGVGAAMVALGIGLGVASRTEVQGGSTTMWTPASP